MAYSISASLELAAQDPFLTTLLALVTYTLLLALYRLSLHPLASFPGSKLAAATAWYHFYHDLLTSPGGQSAKHVNHSHDTYSPIVRMTPDELHIRDPDFYDAVYTSAVKRDKYPPWAAIGGNAASSFATVGHELHRRRRTATNPMVSRKRIVENLPLFLERVEVLCGVLSRAAETGEVVELDVVAMGFTLGLAAAFLFGREMGLQEDLVAARA